MTSSRFPFTIAKLAQLWSRQKFSQKSVIRRGVRLQLEYLEDRVTPTTLNYLVNTLSPISGSPTATSGGIVNAINAANADTADTSFLIAFSPSVFAGGTGSITLTSGLALSPTNANLLVAIDATSVGGVTINGAGTESNFSIFEINSGIMSLTDLTIANGHTTNSGGGIYNDSNLTLTNCTFKNKVLPQNSWVNSVGLCPTPQDFRGMALASKGQKAPERANDQGPMHLWRTVGLGIPCRVASPQSPTPFPQLSRV